MSIGRSLPVAARVRDATHQCVPAPECDARPAAAFAELVPGDRHPSLALIAFCGD
ncbi:MAG UNVERIFIED_CONTAM: hypothetical protein LVR18_16075 [Planctomycetaceae bacterium]